MVAKDEKDNRRKSVKQNSGPGRRAMQPLIWGLVSTIVIALGIFK